jgi:carbohydrate binding protein with CBM5/12 domain
VSPALPLVARPAQKSWQAGSPTDPLPANQVAGDFASHKASIDAVIEFQKLVQRSDGRLNNGSVRPETLSAGTVALIGKWTPRGNWLTATAYAANDLVSESNNLYVCIVAHTSGTFATDLAASDWQLIDGDTARAGADNTFTGANTFSGALNVNGAADFNGAVDMTGGTPTVATKAVGDNTTAVASTAFVQAAVGKVYPPQVFTSPPTTITMTIASPAVLSWTAHGLPIGGAFQLTTTGALPTGVSASTTYYVISAGFGANSFRFAAAPGGAAINTTGSQSGTHTGTPFYVPRAGMVRAPSSRCGAVVAAVGARPTRGPQAPPALAEAAQAVTRARW